MNSRKIVFSGIITCAVGTGLAFLLLHLSPYIDRGRSSPWQNTYTFISGVTGLLVGSSLEAIRQLKKQQDEDEALAEEFKKAKAAFPQFNTDISPSPEQ